MKDELLYNFYVFSGNPVSRSSLKIDLKQKIVYEVVRLIEGVPLFFEDHFQRLLNSISIFKIHFDFPEMHLFQSVKLLMSTTGVTKGNIKISVTYSKSENKLVYYIYFIEHKYPSESEYLNGVRLKSFRAVRRNPRFKMYLPVLKKNINEFIKEKDIYEVVLLKNNILTEGSKSNLFFIRNQTLFTTPEELVLTGITRKYVKKICEENHFSWIEKKIKLKDIHNYESCFISGTSPMILPVRQLDETFFQVHNSLLRNIMNKYDEKINAYIHG
ncbi:aminotransferase class IV [Bacteroidota bacterium]